MAPGCSLWSVAAEPGVLIAALVCIASILCLVLRSLDRDRTGEYGRTWPSWMDER